MAKYMKKIKNEKVQNEFNDMFVAISCFCQSLFLTNNSNDYPVYTRSNPDMRYLMSLVLFVTVATYRVIYSTGCCV